VAIDVDVTVEPVHSATQVQSQPIHVLAPSELLLILLCNAEPGQASRHYRDARNESLLKETRVNTTGRTDGHDLGARSALAPRFLHGNVHSPAGKRKRNQNRTMVPTNARIPSSASNTAVTPASEAGRLGLSLRSTLIAL
jgi:hypothetical protein